MIAGLLGLGIALVAYVLGLGAGARTLGQTLLRAYVLQRAKLGREPTYLEVLNAFHRKP